MQEQLRHLSRQILQAQEEERKRISRELHDVIAQTLTGISIRLTALKTGVAVNAKGLQKKIASTQRLVEESVRIVHQFARELRPSVLDDLGLIPALHSFVKTFADRTRLRIRLRIFAGVEQLDAAQRTVLYRVAQEALTNVARHAHATQVEMCIEKTAGSTHMWIRDDGRSFPVDQTLRSRKNNRLGLLGMRERVEMVGGSFGVESAPGKGTTIEVQIPFRDVRGVGKHPIAPVMLPAKNGARIRASARSQLRGRKGVARARTTEV
jgi:signal transduction histidine kinase